MSFESTLDSANHSSTISIPFGLSIRIVSPSTSELSTP